MELPSYGHWQGVCIVVRVLVGIWLCCVVWQVRNVMWSHHQWTVYNKFFFFFSIHEIFVIINKVAKETLFFYKVRINRKVFCCFSYQWSIFYFAPRAVGNRKYGSLLVRTLHVCQGHLSPKGLMILFCVKDVFSYLVGRYRSAGQPMMCLTYTYPWWRILSETRPGLVV